MAFFGGLYSNYLALQSAIDDALKRGVSRMFCLGDMGAFGPHPDRVFPLLREYQVTCIQGNYDHSIGNGLADCQCGYTDPRDNYFARISYRYTFDRTSLANREWMRLLPPEYRFTLDGNRFLLCHGSPRQTNEFLWESATSSAFLERLMKQHECDFLIGTHTGIHWKRTLADGRQFVNAGVLGRPENDGRTNVWYTLVTTGDDLPEQGGKAGEPYVEFIPVEYDHERLAAEMRSEGLPEEFVETTLTGWWTTCLEILPGRERARGRH